MYSNWSFESVVYNKIKVTHSHFEDGSWFSSNTYNQQHNSRDDKRTIETNAKTTVYPIFFWYQCVPSRVQSFGIRRYVRIVTDRIDTFL